MRARFRTENKLDGFAEHEVLEILLYDYLPRVNTNETAHRLLARFGNIRSVLTADVTELSRVEGVGLKCAERLVFLGQVFRRAEKESYITVRADDFESLSAYLKSFYLGDRSERLCAFAISSAGMVTACSVLSVGVTDKVAFNADELKRFLLYNNTSTLLLTHNHPFGSAMPSREDLLLTRRIQTMLGTEIRLLDHIIVGENDVVSLRRTGSLRAFE